MSKEFEIEIKNQAIKAKKENKEDDYEIRTKDGGKQTIKFVKGEKDELSEVDVKLQWRKKGEDDKKWQDFAKKAKYTGGMFFDDFELENNEITPDLKTEKSLKPGGIGFFKSMKWPVYLIIIVIVVALVALIWWWVASNKSEDKEEESL